MLTNDGISALLETDRESFEEAVPEARQTGHKDDTSPMEPQKLTGPAAGALKYDLLTALSVAGLNGSPSLQTSFMRLIALITARYNWRADEFCVGQRDMARMWSVNERTVKREVKRLTETGVLICKRPGVRGRVGAYTLNYTRIAELSQNSWPLVGPDFDARMRERYVSETAKIVSIKQFRDETQAVPEPAKAGTWDAAMAQLAKHDPSLHHAWFARLTFVSCTANCLKLRAPSRFVQRYIETHHMPVMLRFAEAELGVIDHVEFVA